LHDLLVGFADEGTTDLLADVALEAAFDEFLRGMSGSKAGDGRLARSSWNCSVSLEVIRSWGISMVTFLVAGPTSSIFT